MSVGTQLRKFRKLKGMSQTALAKKAGVVQTLVSRVESGCGCTPQNLKKLCEALNVEMKEMMNGKKPKASRSDAEGETLPEEI